MFICVLFTFSCSSLPKDFFSFIKSYMYPLIVQLQFMLCNLIHVICYIIAGICNISLPSLSFFFLLRLENAASSIVLMRNHTAFPPEDFPWSKSKAQTLETPSRVAQLNGSSQKNFISLTCVSYSRNHGILEQGIHITAEPCCYRKLINTCWPISIENSAALWYKQQLINADSTI